MSLRTILPLGAVALSLAIVAAAISVNSHQHVGQPLTALPEGDAVAPVVPTSSSVVAPSGAMGPSLSIVGSHNGAGSNASVPLHPDVPLVPTFADPPSRP